MGPCITEQCYILGRGKKKRMLKKFSLKKANMMKIRFPEWAFTKHLHTHSLNSHIMTCLLWMRRMFKKNKESIISHRKLTLEVALITSFYFCVLSHFSCVWLCGPMDCSPPGSSVHGIVQARILEWVAMRSSKESSWFRDRTHVSYVSCTGRQVLFH